ncbi:MAG: hypothetical protein DRH43_10765, partial [Deltaproteobacteria bacterium]
QAFSSGQLWQPGTISLNPSFPRGKTLSKIPKQSFFDFVIPHFPSPYRAGGVTLSYIRWFVKPPSFISALKHVLSETYFGKGKSGIFKVYCPLLWENDTDDHGCAAFY